MLNNSVHIHGDIVVDNIEGQRNFGGGAYFAGRYFQGKGLSVSYDDSRYSMFIDADVSTLQRGVLSEIEFGKPVKVSREPSNNRIEYSVNTLITASIILATPTIYADMSRISRFTDTKSVYIDIQGYLRAFDGDGNYSRVYPDISMIQDCEAIKMNKRELDYLNEGRNLNVVDTLLEQGNRLVIVTNGKEQTHIYSSSEIQVYSPRVSPGIVGRFGDGDTFFASFAYHHGVMGLTTMDSIHSASEDAYQFLTTQSWRS